MYLCLLEIQVGSLAGAESYPVLVGWRGAVFSCCTMRALWFPEILSMGSGPK